MSRVACLKHLSPNMKTRLQDHSVIADDAGRQIRCQNIIIKNAFSMLKQYEFSLVKSHNKKKMNKIK